MFRKHLLPLVRPHMRELLAAGGCMGLVSFSLGMQVFLIRQSLDSLFVAHERAALPWLAAAVGVVMLTQSLGELGRGFFMRRAGLRIMRGLRRMLFCHIQRFSVEQLERRSLGELSALLGADVEGVQRLLTVVITLGQKPLSLLVLLAVAFWQEPILTGLALGLLPLILFPLQRLKRWVKQRAQEAQQAGGELHEVLRLAYQGARTIQSFQLEPHLQARFERALATQERAQLEALLATQLSGPLVQLVTALGVSFAIGLGGWWVLEGQKSAGSLVAFVLSLGWMVDPLKSLAQVPLLWAQARVGLERSFALLEERPALRDGWREPPPAHEHWTLELRGVSVKAADTYILKDVSCQIQAGEWVALVGPSGGGKSTLLSLLARWREPTEGEILLNGHPMAEYRLEALRRMFSVVPQETFLFPERMWDNLCWSAAVPPLEHETALKYMNLLGFSAVLQEGEGGLERRVGEGAGTLSGGERQRLALVRALLRPAPFLLLDEPAAALDEENEQRLGVLLEQVRGGRGVLMVSHQPGLVARADRILRLEGGRLCADCSHNELYREDITY